MISTGPERNQIIWTDEFANAVRKPAANVSAK